jgi:hypothetical protein
VGGISLVCIASSYGLALALELSRLAVRLPARRILVLSAMAAGIVANLAHLWVRGQAELGYGAGLLATWYDWSLLSALALALGSWWLTWRRPESTVGYFLLPPVLALTALAWWVQDAAPFSRDDAVTVWRSLHAAGMAAGVATVLMGLSAGVMYLVHSTRLKHKRANSSILRLPPLEWLQALNRSCLLIGTLSLSIGLLAGVVMSLNRDGRVSWTEPGVLLSGLLLLWLLAAIALEYFYRPAHQGRKMAYLMVANAGFLALALYGVLGFAHGNTDHRSDQPIPRAPAQRSEQP